MAKMQGSKGFEAKLWHKVSPHDLKRIMLAYRLAKYGHRGQTRDGGERYFEHPRAVALILVDELEIYDPEMLIAALLHDLQEDTWMLEWEDIETIFGSRVLHLVRMLTKEHNSTSQETRVYLQSIVLADEDVRIIKLADRLHNTRTLKECTPEKQARKLEETREFFLPMAQATHPALARKLHKACAVLERTMTSA